MCPWRTNFLELQLDLVPKQSVAHSCCAAFCRTRGTHAARAPPTAVGRRAARSAGGSPPAEPCRSRGRARTAPGPLRGTPGTRPATPPSAAPPRPQRSFSPCRRTRGTASCPGPRRTGTPQDRGAGPRPPRAAASAPGGTPRTLGPAARRQTRPFRLSAPPPRPRAGRRPPHRGPRRTPPPARRTSPAPPAARTGPDRRPPAAGHSHAFACEWPGPPGGWPGSRRPRRWWCSLLGPGPGPGPRFLRSHCLRRPITRVGGP